MGERSDHLLTIQLIAGKVVFPDGSSHCLACGAKSSGTRHVVFTGVLDLDAPDPIQAPPKNANVEFNAPLCQKHLRTALLMKFGAIGLLLLTIGILAGGAALGLKSWLLGILVVPSAIFALVLWYFKDKGGLACSAGTGRKDGVGLWYFDGGPRA